MAPAAALVAVVPREPVARVLVQQQVLQPQLLVALPHLPPESAVLAPALAAVRVAPAQPPVILSRDGKEYNLTAHHRAGRYRGQGGH